MFEPPAQAGIPGAEVRSHFIEPRGEGLPSDTDPCRAPEGTHWIWARTPDPAPVRDLRVVGRWSPGEVAIYSMPPYRELHEHAENLGAARSLIEGMRP